MKTIEQIIKDIDSIPLSEEQKLEEGFLNAAKNFFGTAAGLLKGKNLDQIKQDRFDALKAKNDKILDAKKQNLNRLHYISSLFDEIVDKNGKYYRITGDIEDSIKEFKAALKSGKFTEYDLKTAKYISELLDSGYEKELRKLNTDTYNNIYANDEKGLSAYILDLIDGKVDVKPSKGNNDIDICLNIIEKIIEHVRFNLTNDKCFTFACKVQDFFNNGRTSNTTFEYKGVQLPFDEIFKDICAELGYDPEESANIYRKLYVSNNINTTHIYQINKFGTYTDYVKAFFTSNGKSLENLIIATLEYSVIDIVRLIADKYQKQKGSNELQDLKLREHYAKLYSAICDEGLLTANTIIHLYHVSTSVNQKGSFDPQNQGTGYFNTEITLKLERIISLKGINVN